MDRLNKEGEKLLEIQNKDSNIEVNINNKSVEDLEY